METSGRSNLEKYPDCFNFVTLRTLTTVVISIHHYVFVFKSVQFEADSYH